MARTKKSPDYYQKKYARQAAFNAEQGAVIYEEARYAQFNGRGSAFRSTRMSKLSDRTQIKAQYAKESLITFATLYGTPEQAAFMRQIDPSKVRWMHNEGIADLDVFFDYKPGTTDYLGGRLEGTGIAASKIQGYIDAYMYLQREGR